MRFALLDLAIAGLAIYIMLRGVRRPLRSRRGTDVC